LPTYIEIPLATLPETTPPETEVEATSTAPAPAKTQPLPEVVPAKLEAPKMALPKPYQQRFTSAHYHNAPLPLPKPAPNPEEEALKNQQRYKDNNWGAKLKPHMESLFGRSINTR
jgi:hypothetical protein